MLRVLQRATLRRQMATLSASQAMQPYMVFDRDAKRKQKDRVALKEEGNCSRLVDYVRDEVADRMMERLLDIKRTYTSILDVGSGPGHFSKLLDPQITKKVVMLDFSEKTLHRDSDKEFDVPVERIHADEEQLLETILPGSQEAIVSCLNLHWVNDLPGILIQIRQALKPDGFFLGALFGGDTLFELRTAMQLAEVEREGGISPHVSPMTDTRDISNLLGRAGFTLLTVDVDDVVVSYPSIFELVEDLKNMGEGNAVVNRRNFLHRDTLLAASAAYQGEAQFSRLKSGPERQANREPQALHGHEDGTIPATFQIGWKPAPSQPKPLERGSAKVNLKDVL